MQKYPTLLLVIAYATRRLPYVVRSPSPGCSRRRVDLELAAANLGASTATTLRRITVPLIVANLIAGALLAFAFAMLEVSDSLILAQRQRLLPDHQGDLRALPAPRRRPVHRQRAGRLGDGPADADDPVGQRCSAKNGRHLPSLKRGQRSEVIMSRGTGFQTRACAASLSALRSLQ